MLPGRIIPNTNGCTQGANALLRTELRHGKDHQGDSIEQLNEQLTNHSAPKDSSYATNWTRPDGKRRNCGQFCTRKLNVDVNGTARCIPSNDQWSLRGREHGLASVLFQLEPFQPIGSSTVWYERQWSLRKLSFYAKFSCVILPKRCKKMYSKTQNSKLKSIKHR